MGLIFINDCKSDVTPNIIAMGFPSESMEATYRNPMKEVLRFAFHSLLSSFFLYFNPAPGFSIHTTRTITKFTTCKYQNKLMRLSSIDNTVQVLRKRL